MMEQISDEVADWIGAVVPVLRAVKTREGQEWTGLELIAEKFRVPGNAGMYIDTLVVLYDEMTDSDGQCDIVLRPLSASPRSVVTELSQRTTNGKVRAHATKVLYLMLKIPEKWPWDEYVNVVAGRLHDAYRQNENVSEIGQGEYAGLIGTLLMLSELGGVREARKVLEQLSTDGTLQIVLNLSSKHVSSAAACMLSLLYVGDKYQKNALETSASLRRHKRTKAAHIERSLPGENSSERVKAIEKGRQIFHQVVETPSSDPELVNEMRLLAKRCGIEIENMHTELDLSMLEGHL